MPNWSDGEGGCDCPSGHQAGLGRHREGEPGCISGPNEFVGKKTVTTTRLAGIITETREASKARPCAGCGAHIDMMNACLWDSFSDQVFCSDACLRKAHPDRARPTKKTIEELIDASSLGTARAKRLRRNVPGGFVAKVLERADALEKEKGPFPSPFTPEVPQGKWQVAVLGGEDGADLRTVFSSGVQHFELARADAGDKDGRERCEFIARMFRKAMAALGSPPEWNGKK